MAAASRSLLTRVAVLFAEHGLAGEAHRAERLRLCSDHAGRHLHTSAQLTTAEAETLIARLAALPADVDLRHAAGRLTHAEETRAAVAASGAHLCGPKPPTSGDLAQVAAFARHLDQNRKAPR